MMICLTQILKHPFKGEDILHATKKQEKELKRAQDLFNDGILNEEEFKNLKEEILQ